MRLPHLGALSKSRGTRLLFADGLPGLPAVMRDTLRWIPLALGAELVAAPGGHASRQAAP